MELAALTFERDGAAHRPAAVCPMLNAIEHVIAGLPERAGSRLYGIAGLSSLLASDGPIAQLAMPVMGMELWPVRAVLFDKTPGTNWTLGWHQDRAICVRKGRQVDGFGPWTTKAGLLHVSPPSDLLTRMLTVRVHLHPVSPDNAPLLIAPGSHRLGQVPVAQIDEARRRCGEVACLAEVGDVWLYATPILHASAAARRETRRRVLQVDDAAEELPGGLAWLGV